MLKSLFLGLAMAGAYLGWQFGGSLARLNAMQAAANELRYCQTDMECDAAWERVEMIRRVK